jgi:hypothetical protein
MGSNLANIALGVARASRNRSVLQDTPADIIQFIESPWGIHMPLFPVQRVILKAYYGLELDDKDTFEVYSDWHLNKIRNFTEAGYLRYLHDEGRCNVREIVPGKPKTELVLSIGRRGGKTLLSSCISSYESYRLIMKGDPKSYYGISPSTTIQIIAIATDKDQAGLLYTEVSGHFRGCDFFGPYTANNTLSYARFQTPSDIEKYGRYADNPSAMASVKVTFRSCIAKGLRGPGNIVVIMDEAAHFTDGGQSSAEAVYTAVTPSTSTFAPKDPNDKRKPIGDVEGKIISISSPLGKQGHFYKLFQTGMKGGKAGASMLCIQAPTWEANPTLPASEYEKHYHKDPTIFFTEYGGEFTDRTRGWLERPEDLIACVDKTRRPMTNGIPRQPHFIGIDLGLVNDATAVAIGHHDLIGGQKKIVLDLVDQIKAGEGKFSDVTRLEFDDVADWILQLSKRFYLAEGMFDQWTGIPFEQALEKRGLRQLKSVVMTKALNSEIYRNFKDVMWDKWLVLYDWPIPADTSQGAHCAYLEELFELQAEYQSKYVTVVHAPQIEGKHDDRSDALVRMIWMASNALGNMKHMTGTRGGFATLGSYQAFESMWRKSRIKALRGGSSPERQIPRQGRQSLRTR